MYARGAGVAQSETEAVKWYRKSAEQGNVFGQLNLGLMYRQGRGVSQSDTEAVKWFRLAAEQGNAPASNWAQNNLEAMGIDRTKPQIAEPQSEPIYWELNREFIANISSSESIIMIKIAFMTYDDRVIANIEKHSFAVRSAVLDVMRNARESDLVRPDFRVNLAQQIRVVLNETLEEAENFGEKVYFSEYLVNTKEKDINQVADTQRFESGEKSRVRELEEELLALKAEKEIEARSINQDSLRPTLQIIGKYSEDATGFIEGRVTDNVGVVELFS